MSQRSLTPYVVVRVPEALIEFIEEAFGGEELERLEDGEGEVLHAEVRIGDSTLLIGGAAEGQDTMPGGLYHHVADVDAVHARAILAGGVEVMPPCDQALGERMSGLVDPHGNYWWLATKLDPETP